MSDLSERQSLIYNFIADYKRDNGFGPSLREIADGVGLKSVSSVHYQLQQLQDTGYIRILGKHARAIQVIGNN